MRPPPAVDTRKSAFVDFRRGPLRLAPYRGRRYPQSVPRFLRGARAPRDAQRVPRARGRPDAAAHHGGHGAVQALLRGRRDSPQPAARLVPEVLPHDRHRRRGRLHPPHDVRDAGQLQHRRLLQARGDRLGVGVRHGGASAPARAHLGYRARLRRGGARDLARRDRRPQRAHRYARRQGQLLGARWRRGRVRPVQRAPLRPRRGARPRHAPRRRHRPVHRVLEPRVPAVPPGSGRLAHEPARPRHRHGDGARPHHRDYAGSAVGLRDRPAPPHPRGRRAYRRRPVRRRP